MIDEVVHDGGSRNARLGLKLGLVAGLMVCMAPVMYFTGGLVCDWAGIGFNPDGDDKIAEGEGLGREVSCTFTAVINESLAGKVRFEVSQPTQVAEIGDAHAGRNTYTLANLTDEPLFIRPIHYVSPPQASRKFRMTECFCYNDMELAPGEERELVVVYGFKADMDARVAEALINYTVEAIPEADLRPVITMPKSGAFDPSGLDTPTEPIDGGPQR